MDKYIFNRRTFLEEVKIQNIFNIICIFAEDLKYICIAPCGTFICLKTSVSSSDHIMHSPSSEFTDYMAIHWSAVVHSVDVVILTFDPMM